MMDASTEPESIVAEVAAAIGEKARARMLFCLLDGRARTSTELSAAADVGPSTASAHLARLCSVGLIRVSAQGRHRYFSLGGIHVAEVLEGLSRLVSDAPAAGFTPRTPARLRSARTCYDHAAGTIAVKIHDRLLELGWLSEAGGAYDLTGRGNDGLSALGVDIESARKSRRKFACPCLDWSERRPHLAGSLGAAILAAALGRGWVVRDLDGRALEVSARGRRELLYPLGVEIDA
jgi:DNA-binding transcriptional ArsR family regulator